MGPTKVLEAGERVGPNEALNIVATILSDAGQRDGFIALKYEWQATGGQLRCTLAFGATTREELRRSRRGILATIVIDTETDVCKSVEELTKWTRHFLAQAKLIAWARALELINKGEDGDDIWNDFRKTAGTGGCGGRDLLRGAADPGGTAAASDGGTRASPAA